jgi:steroid 5-alpha reductase family enzyme
MSDFPWVDFARYLPFGVLAVVAVEGVTFVVALRVGRHAVVDVAWGLGFVAIAASAFVASSATGDGARRTLLLVLTTAWGLRLAGHIALRSRGHGEDPRYEALMAKAPGSPQVHAFVRIYLTQAAVMWFVSLPVQVGAFETRHVGWLGWLGLGVWAVGFVFEAVGDWQLTRFRNHPASRGEVLDTGLWHYTRHPNYFGDACVWWGLSLLAFDEWPGIVTVLSALAMTWLLAKGTGKPLLEKDMSSRRPAYADYVRRTSGFVPMPPKKTAAS